MSLTEISRFPKIWPLLRRLQDQQSAIVGAIVRHLVNLETLHLKDLAEKREKRARNRHGLACGIVIPILGRSSTSLDRSNKLQQWCHFFGEKITLKPPWFFTTGHTIPMHLYLQPVLLQRVNITWDESVLSNAKKAADRMREKGSPPVFLSPAENNMRSCFRSPCWMFQN